MSLQIRRGPTVDRSNITPNEGEIIYDTSEKALYVGDGSTPGGIAVSVSSTGNVQDIAASLFENGQHTNLVYSYDSVNSRINSAVDLTNYVGQITSDGFVGSIYAYDDSLMVDGILKSFNLDQTIRTNVVPNSDDTYDLGSASNRFRDLYLSGSSLLLGDATINAVGSIIDLPFGSTVDGVLIGDGSGDGVIAGSNLIFCRLCSLIVDASNSSISAAGGITGNLIGDVTGDVTGNIIGNDSSIFVNSETKTVFGNLFGDIEGSVFSETSSVLVNAFNSEISGKFIGELASDLNTRGFSLVNLGNVNISPTGYTQLGSESTPLNGSLVIRRSSFTNGVLNGLSGFLFDQYHNNSGTDRMIFHRSRGTHDAPLPLQAGDRLGEIAFVGNTSVDPFSSFSSTIRAVATSGPVGNLIPTNMEFLCLDSASDPDPRVMLLTPDKKILTDRIEGYRTTLTVVGDLTGSVFSDDSTKVVDGITGSVTAGSYVQFGSLTTSERDALTAAFGMVIYNTTANRFQGYQNTGGTTPQWINLDDGSIA